MRIFQNNFNLIFILENTKSKINAMKIRHLKKIRGKKLTNQLEKWEMIKQELVMSKITNRQMSRERFNKRKKINEGDENNGR